MTTEADILALDEARINAQVAADAAAMERLFSDNLVYTHSNALVDTKRSYIDGIVSGKFAYEAINRSEQVVHIYGEAALIAGKAEIHVNGRHLRLRFLAVWAKEGGDWRFVGWQSTPLPA